LVTAFAMNISHEFPMCIDPDMDVPLVITCLWTSFSFSSSAILSIQCFNYITFDLIDLRIDKIDY